jgi:hypothetical protein
MDNVVVVGGGDGGEAIALVLLFVHSIFYDNF